MTIQEINPNYLFFILIVLYYLWDGLFSDLSNFDCESEIFGVDEEEGVLLV